MTMAREYSPQGFSHCARADASVMLEDAKFLAEALAAHYLDARKILERDAGSEGLIFPFFRDQISTVEELIADLEASIAKWRPQPVQSTQPTPDSLR